MCVCVCWVGGTHSLKFGKMVSHETTENKKIWATKYLARPTKVRSLSVLKSNVFTECFCFLKAFLICFSVSIALILIDRLNC